MQLNQWRTFSGVLALGLMMLGAEWMVPHEQRHPVALQVIIGLGGLGLFLAGKAYGQHRANAQAEQQK